MGEYSILFFLSYSLWHLTHSLIQSLAIRRYKPLLFAHYIFHPDNCVAPQCSHVSGFPRILYTHLWIALYFASSPFQFGLLSSLGSTLRLSNSKFFWPSYLQWREQNFPRPHFILDGAYHLSDPQFWHVVFIFIVV